MLEKITAVASVPQTKRDPGADARFPAAGETIRLSLDAVAADHLLATTPDGLALRLNGLGRLAGEMIPGDLLLLRVVATEPSLTLSLVDKISASAPASVPDAAMEPAAMRADQLAWRYVRLPVPDAATLAASWRAQVLHGLEHTSTSGEQQASAVFIAGLREAGATLRQDPALAKPQVPDYWMFALNGWTGAPVLLRLLDDDTDTDDMPKMRRQRMAILRLELDLPEQGRIAVQVQLAGGGICLTFEVLQDSALDFLRSTLSDLVEALARAGLPVRRLRLGHAQTGAGAPAGTAHVSTWSSAMLPASLFRAAAEVTLALSSAASS